MLSKEEEGEVGPDAEVTKEDQDKINSFSRLHNRERLLEEELQGKQKDKEDLEEVSTELELADEDEVVHYKIGDSFISLPLAEAQSMLSSATEQVDGEVSRLEESLQELKEQKKTLKAQLYARFGKAINLDWGSASEENCRAQALIELVWWYCPAIPRVSRTLVGP